MSRLLRRASVGAAILGLVAVGALRAQTEPVPGIDNTAFGTTSAEFLLLGAGARGAALGNSFAALATDPTALYWNPAGLAEMPRPGVTISTYDYLADTRYSWGGLAFPFGGGQSAIGVQIGTFGFSDQPVYTLNDPEGDGTTYGVSETFVGLTYARNFSDRFSAGITGKFISDRLGKTDATAIAVDFGTSFHALIGGRPIRASFVVANLGSGLQHTGVGLDVNVERQPPPGQQQIPQDPQPSRYQSEAFGLPVVFRVGLAYDFVNTTASRVTLTSSFSQPNNSNATAGGGLELALSDIGQTGFSVVARGSYTYQPDNDFAQAATPDAGFATALSSDEDLDGLALGGGLGYSRGSFYLGLDYAYRHLGILGGTNVFSATVYW
ncbi:MAG: PorV/PorQ family protein [Gemmatimonadales bacterium]|nr:PorV/PorQ family protein [Gemmatimonadales bacterium]NIR00073.1 PorV/PorQ family protein [Gemmatimonadales bacterium]NIS66536.1 PorV/PorQ family protein [Gemmatimonadales bacterium]